MSNCLQISIGNDLVDLSEDTIPLHQRYKKRVFTDYELSAISDSTKLLWLYWSAKESAYKAFKRLTPTASFIPIQFEFDLTTNQIIKDDKIFANCRSVITNDYIYTTCVTCANGASLEKTKSWVGAQKIKSARFLACEKICSEYLLNSNELEIRSDSKAIPKLFYKGRESNQLISLTDHGRFVACMVYEQ